MNLRNELIALFHCSTFRGHSGVSVIAKRLTLIMYYGGF